MTIANLIQQLQNYPPDAIVCILSKNLSVYKLYLKPVCYTCPCYYETLLNYNSESNIHFNYDVTITDVTAVSDIEANCVILNTY